MNEAPHTSCVKFEAISLNQMTHQRLAADISKDIET
jgi:hypothetical protein